MQRNFSPQEHAKAMEAEKQRIENNMRKIKHKILVLSGKGGVGKTTLAVNLSVVLMKKGYQVGILDVDIHGPNVPKMLGLERDKLQSKEEKIIPSLWKENLRVVSMAFLLEDRNTPIIWRGPLKANIIRQFLADVEWGELDFLIVDSPPGTGDEPLSVCQLIPAVDLAIVVTTPQEVSLLDSRKAVNFAKELKAKRVGIVENMRGLICPYCSREIFLFKKGGGEDIAREFKVEFLGSLPIEPGVVEAGDAGEPVILKEGKIKESLETIAREIEKWLK